MGQQGFWDWEKRHGQLVEQKSFLTQLDELIPWSEFRPLLEQVYQQPLRFSICNSLITQVIR